MNRIASWTPWAHYENELCCVMEFWRVRMEMIQGNEIANKQIAKIFDLTFREIHQN